MHTKNHLNIFLILLVALLLGAFGPVLKVHADARKPAAQAGSAMDLINAVNAFRAQNDLAPYEVDGGLMSLAQGQSEYQASIDTCTHQRADGSGPADSGISAENIACGANLTIESAIYSQWTDAVHNATLLGPTTGQVGAGVASAGSTVYYTLDVRRLSGDFVYRPPKSSGSVDNPNIVNAADTGPASVQMQNGGIVTSTPNADGSVSHVVKYGETLFDIAQAYNVPLNDLVGINHLDAKNPAIYEKQVLLIRLAPTPTTFVTSTNTPRPPTRTPVPTRTLRPTRTATPYHTPVPTQTATATPIFRVPSLEELGPGRNILGYTFIAISALGLVVLGLTAFGSRKEK